MKNVSPTPLWNILAFLWETKSSTVLVSTGKQSAMTIMRCVIFEIIRGKEKHILDI
uniref:Uncharacterized protein n=1 Tax=Marseillevirus sp. TaxID=2809551 RepID=A0AA96EP39_9VIRU|nr:hypothetical protein MarDSR_070 [Marseillevirus sp.]